MAADPRGHRRHRAHRAAGLARIQQLHPAGQVITCCLCRQPLDPFQPHNRGRNPLAPTLEHATPLSSGGPLYQDNGPEMWCHRGCNSRQGGQISSTRKARTSTNSRRW